LPMGDVEAETRPNGEYLIVFTKAGGLDEEDEYDGDSEEEAIRFSVSRFISWVGRDA
jgi:hypothetical protein